MQYFVAHFRLTLSAENEYFTANIDYEILQVSFKILFESLLSFYFSDHLHSLETIY